MATNSRISKKSHEGGRQEADDPMDGQGIYALQGRAEGSQVGDGMGEAEGRGERIGRLVKTGVGSDPESDEGEMDDDVEDMPEAKDVFPYQGFRSIEKGIEWQTRYKGLKKTEKVSHLVALVCSCPLVAL